MEKNLFELATRCKYRFPYRGQITIEDLWDLRLADLDSVFKTLNAEVKKASEESLLKLKTKEDEDVCKLDTIKVFQTTKPRQVVSQFQFSLQIAQKSARTEDALKRMANQCLL